MLVFGQEAYSRKKYEIEHCDGKIMLVKACHPHKQSTMVCTDIYLPEDVETCTLDGIGGPFLSAPIIPKRTFYSVGRCKACDLRLECNAPVVPSIGMHNAIIVGEAPGADEDKLGLGFVGRSGNSVWEALAKHGIERGELFVTNVVKCFPSTTRTPSKKHIRACSKWLNLELKTIKPLIALAFGNTCLKFFKGQDSGIMELNGKTEWLDKYGMWVCWCIHPASVLYHQENAKPFAEGIGNFAAKYKILLCSTATRYNRKGR
jgi:DNA polymerase